MGGFATFALGIVVGTILAILLSYLPISQYNEAIEICEKSLPRDQHCKVIGIPIVKETK